MSLLYLTGCSLEDSNPASDQTLSLNDPSPSALVARAAATAPLEASWTAYRQRFIQADGRVIDREDQDRSTSEGQAYAMLRAVLIDDPGTFAQTLNWAENNLRHVKGGQLEDRLWGWKWGRRPDGNWGLIDANFASDADIDAITALILAARRWNRPDYLELAQAKLEDLWRLSTVEVQGQRYLLPGPAIAFQTETQVYFNPSYLAPYAFRLFAQVDPERDWLSLVDSSYQILEESATLSSLGLPSDWVGLDRSTGRFVPLDLNGPLPSRYGFDAYRVWWRVAWDVEWFDAPRGRRYLEQHLPALQTLWQTKGAIPAELDLQGKPLVDYESTAQYAMLQIGFRVTQPAIAQQIQQQKIAPQYQQGFWDNPSAYYTQNLVWLSLFPREDIPPELLKPQ